MTNINDLKLDNTLAGFDFESSSDKGVIGDLLSSFGNILSGRGVGDLVGGDAGGGGLGNLFDQQQRFFELQVQVQAQQQLFSMQSNISKAEHEARMASVRNMKP